MELTTGRALLRAYDALSAFAENPAVFQTVLTGNLREVARIKLEVFSLDQFLDLDAGAYGDDHQELAELVAIAQGRAGQRAGVAFGNDATVLIGDAPNDVKAGLEAGVPVIGVATGKSSGSDLQAAGATWVIDAVAHIGALCRSAGSGLEADRGRRPSSFYNAHEDTVDQIANPINK